MNEYYLFLDNLSLLLRNGYSIKEERTQGEDYENFDC